MHVYHNKKDQSPSYCDRILWKNNTTDAVDVKGYDAYHDVYGSDHRPVTLSMDIKMPHYQYFDLLSDKSSGILELKKLQI